MAGCSTADLEKINSNLAGVNAALAGKSGASTASAAPTASAIALAKPAATEGKSTQLIVPTDKATAQAMDEALPVVKKILAIHQCATDYQSLRLLNPYAVPGKVFGTQNSLIWGEVVGAIPANNWKYHQKSTCASIRAIDNWKMLALNALTLRASFLADDSGEADAFHYKLVKSPSGSWELSALNRHGGF